MREGGKRGKEKRGYVSRGGKRYLHRGDGDKRKVKEEGGK